MKISILMMFVLMCITSTLTYHDGAREESCYDQLVNHTGSIGLDCIVGSHAELPLLLSNQGGGG